ncbi:dirigent protein [Streptomyces sp. NPDC050564]|uniref:dirigent protein n=1 Tax=Streptomyces sp. NPDC050564 TaxID=3365631 RepID=UPI0037AEC3AB
MRPIRAACLGTATVLVTLLACAPVADAAATDTDFAHAKGGDRVITLIGHLVQQTRFPVNPGGPPAQGDRTVFRSDLYDEHDNQVVGETDGTCTTTRAADINNQAEVCVVNYNFPSGQLTVQGMVFGNLTASPPPSFDNAITGGTGVFDRARGMVHADTIGVGKRRFTIDLDS